MKRYPSLLISLALALLLGTGCASAQQRDDSDPVFSQAELEQMLAPVALYPDSVLSHLLIAATYPLEVVMAERWTRENPGLEGEAALKAVENEDWDPSVKALVAFPDLLQRMSEDLDWTESLGEAFLADEEAVLDSVQNLRQHAYDAGNLDELEHLSVSRDDERQIVIEPVRREVVYIPYYDSRVVYGSWWWADYPPYYWHHHHDHYHHGHSSWVYWGPRVHLSSRFYFSAFRWDHRHIVVIDHHYHDHRLWRARQIARHQRASHWRHNPYHRRGVKYRDARTRDYFLDRKRQQLSTQSRPRVHSDAKAAAQRQPSRVVRPNNAGDKRVNRVRPDKGAIQTPKQTRQAPPIKQRSNPARERNQAPRVKATPPERAVKRQSAPRPATQSRGQRQSHIKSRQRTNPR